jgi:hypothetical protein
VFATAGCELSREKPSAMWEVQEVVEEEEQDYLRHTLFLKQVN